MLDGSQLDFLRSRLGFYDRLSPAERLTLERSSAALDFPAGRSVKSDDEECLGLLLVRSGELRVFIRSEDGREVTLYRLSPGELCVLSASCVLNSIDFDVSIEASRDTQAIKVAVAAFESLARGNVYVENFAYKSAAERFSDVIWAVEQLVFMRFDKRLAIYLLDESLKSASGAVAATHERIARDVGSAREVVSRMLASFASRGLVELGRGSVKVLDRDGLKKLL